MARATPIYTRDVRTALAATAATMLQEEVADQFAEVGAADALAVAWKVHGAALSGAATPSSVVVAVDRLGEQATTAARGKAPRSSEAAAWWAVFAVDALSRAGVEANWVGASFHSATRRESAAVVERWLTTAHERLHRFLALRGAPDAERLVERLYRAQFAALRPLVPR